jgi:hypothetical protein
MKTLAEQIKEIRRAAKIKANAEIRAQVDPLVAQLIKDNPSVLLCDLCPLTGVGLSWITRVNHAYGLRKAGKGSTCYHRTPAQEQE